MELWPVEANRGIEQIISFFTAGAGAQVFMHTRQVQYTPLNYLLALFSGILWTSDALGYTRTIPAL